MSKKQLLPCGCGGEASLCCGFEHRDIYSVECNKCGICTCVYDTEAEAIEAWNKAMGNTEKSSTVEQNTGEWIKDRDAHRCSECHAVLDGDDWTWRNNYYCYHCGAKMKGWDK